MTNLIRFLNPTRLSEADQKQKMIDAFMSASRGTSSEHLALQRMFVEHLSFNLLNF